MNVTIIRSNRKTIALQVHPDLTVTVRAPKRMSDREIRLFVQEKESWIQKHVEQAPPEKRTIRRTGTRAAHIC